MIYWKECDLSLFQPKLVGKRKQVDNNIYTFDIESTSYLVLYGKQYQVKEYLNFSKKEQEDCEFRTCEWIWQFSVNDIVYYGRTWEEFEQFLYIIEDINPEHKIMFIHNLSFEFNFMKSIINFEGVMARKSRKVMRAFIESLNWECRCTYFMSNVGLAKLSDIYNLPIKKLIGDLDYSLIRHPNTPVTAKELGYCEHDCLVVYYYIKQELERYERVDKIPLTNTGHVRKELKSLIEDDWSYKNQVKKAINTDPHIYNLLVKAFMGGYTHANSIYADQIIKNLDSWDFTSSYPYVMVSEKYPSTAFKKCYLHSINQMSDRLAYIVRIRFKNIRSKYYNNFISQSKAYNIRGGRYDNGRIIKADELEMVLTDVDVKLIQETYKYDEYEILESYFSIYRYLPIQYIKFILDKYVDKTKYKGVKGKELEYALIKGMFNSIYGMSVTNNIRDEVEYDPVYGWSERPLTNEEITTKLLDEKKKPFLSFSYGVWVTAYARRNLIENIIKLDDYVVYCDTDSIKVCEGYDTSVIDKYNKEVEEKIKNVSKILNIDIENYAPIDMKGKKHLIGVFDKDAHYEEFITQGAKKYCYTTYKKNKDIDEKSKILKKGEEESLVLEITVSGVPKEGVQGMNSIEDFKDDFVFEHKYTHKNMLVYVEDQKPYELTDYLGNTYKVYDKSGCCLVPTTYELGKALEYANLISEESSSRSIYKE